MFATNKIIISNVTNRSACVPGFGLQTSLHKDSRMVLGKPARESESLVSEIRVQAAVLGSFPFARRYLGNHLLFSFPPAT